MFGTISAIQKDSFEITVGDGQKISVKLTSSTEFRKQRQPARLSDFKVGDAVIVQIGQDAANSSTPSAPMVAMMPAGFARRPGMGGPGRNSGTMGKDYMVGEVKSVEPPKLTILRVDSVTQALELNEETSIRRGRDSITIVDIQPGDHIFARGQVVNDDVFEPKAVNVIPPEQWKRMQEMKEGRGVPSTPERNAAPPSTERKPPEQRN